MITIRNQRQERAYIGKKIPSFQALKAQFKTTVFFLSNTNKINTNIIAQLTLAASLELQILLIWGVISRRLPPQQIWKSNAEEQITRNHTLNTSQPQSSHERNFSQTVCPPFAYKFNKLTACIVAIFHVMIEHVESGIFLPLKAVERRKKLL